MVSKREGNAEHRKTELAFERSWDSDLRGRRGDGFVELALQK